MTAWFVKKFSQRQKMGHSKITVNKFRCRTLQSCCPVTLTCSLVEQISADKALGTKNPSFCRKRHFWKTQICRFCKLSFFESNFQYLIFKNAKKETFKNKTRLFTAISNVLQNQSYKSESMFPHLKNWLVYFFCIFEIQIYWA